MGIIQRCLYPPPQSMLVHPLPPCSVHVSNAASSRYQVQACSNAPAELRAALRHAETCRAVLRLLILRRGSTRILTDGGATAEALPDPRTPASTPEAKARAVYSAFARSAASTTCEARPPMPALSPADLLTSVSHMLCISALFLRGMMICCSGDACLGATAERRS